GNIVKNNASRVGHCVYLKNIGDTNSVAGNNIISNNNLSGLSIYNPYSMQGAIFIMNNMISGTISSSKYGLVDVSYDRNINFYFNSINLLDNGISSCATKFVYGNCRIFNNIFVNQNKSGYNVYYYASVKADNNDFYYQCPYLGWYAGTDYATFKDWKSGSKCDGGGNNLDPKFKSTSDLHVLNSGLNNKGRGIKYTGIIPTDFDGDPRSTTTPDIGADEFTPKYNDVGVDSILSPSGIECGDSQTLVTVRVTNYGTASQSKIPVSFAINGKVVRTDTLAGPLNPGVDSALTFKYKWNTYTGGAYLISAFTSLTIDSNKINDTVQRVVDFNVPSSIKFTKGVKACAMGNYKLYSAATSFHVIFFLFV
ncbi:MAG: hypothetical protein NTX03_07460, partial [Bacteroidetes bacterium]|nr:hypothetical protein [Bacteroidota bacterium]